VIITACVALPAIDAAPAWAATDVARPAAVALRGAVADAVPAAVDDACAAPDTAAASAWAPPPPRLAAAVVASVVGALSVPRLPVVTDAVPGATMLPAATARPVVAAADAPLSAAESERKPPVPTLFDAVAAMGAAALLVATAFVAADPDAGRLAALRAVSTLDATVDGDPLRDDVLFQMAVFVEAMVPVVETAAVPCSAATFATAASEVPAIGAEATVDAVPVDTRLPVPATLTD
jgi:hypothetical protein